MAIIKEYCKNRIILRYNHYNHSFESIQNLVNEARKDFDISPKDTNIVIYGGQRYKGTMGIEFDSTAFIPPEYSEVEELEFRLY